MQLRDGLWHWQAPHPEWNPQQIWPELVSSTAIDDGTRLILVDPQSVPEEVLAVAEEREPVILLTAPWHERDARSLAGRLGAPVYAPRTDTAEDLVQKFGVTPEEAAGGSPDLEWLRAGEAEAHFYEAADRLPFCPPFGVEVFLGREFNDLVLWVEQFGAVIPGDTLVDFGKGFGINEWLRGGVTRAEVVERLRPLLDRPVEHVLPAHGAATDRAALERALATGG